MTTELHKKEKNLIFCYLNLIYPLKTKKIKKIKENKKNLQIAHVEHLLLDCVK